MSPHLKGDQHYSSLNFSLINNCSFCYREKNEKLNEDVAAMQQRLMEAKHDMSRIQSSKDLLEQLKDVETERDVLVNFIQDDMKKSAAITERYDTTEAVLQSEKRARVEVERKLRETTEALGNTEDQLTKCHDKVQTLKSQLDEGREVKHALEMELNEVKISLNRKTVEADELFKMQTSLLTQVINLKSNANKPYLINFLWCIVETGRFQSRCYGEKYSRNDSQSS
jgi:chromosome segregation ATPase